MSETSIAERQIQPYFDMEAFMNMSRETRLGGAVLERLVKLWGEWLPELKAYEVGTGKISYLAIWLPESVEQAVDEAWGKSPSDGFLINNLAQFLCMARAGTLARGGGRGLRAVAASHVGAARGSGRSGAALQE